MRTWLGLLNKMSKSVQPRAKADLHEIWMAETRAEQLVLILQGREFVDGILQDDAA